MLLIRLVAQDKSLDALFSEQPEIMTSILGGLYVLQVLITGAEILLYVKIYQI